MDFAIEDMNALAIVVAALLYFFIGTVWYSPVLFAQAWMRETGKTKEELNPNPFIYILIFILTVIAAFSMACVFEISGLTGLVPGLFAGLVSGLALAAATAITMMFNDYRRYKLYLINVGYHLVSFTVMGALLGLWR
ncbi:DUF1761 domain-containing protein [Gorillibacterium sp. sgz5001074]|uniref:DUF1761 domain-containing protein n=1 Tax=Gorillibacterium sp. sgz5001074 TaxID=3446695 RepID=UPI003F66F039